MMTTRKKKSENRTAVNNFEFARKYGYYGTLTNVDHHYYLLLLERLLLKRNMENR